MDRSDESRIEILRKAKAVQCLHIRPDVLAIEFGIDEKFVREILVELHSQRFISLTRAHGVARIAAKKCGAAADSP